jgi:DHA1 family multidrug resistance protein-like MFS transporter
MNLGTKNTGTAVFWSLCLMGGFMILSSTLSKSGSVFTPLLINLGTPDAWSGIVLSASTIPGILISLPAASLSDIFGRRKFLLLAGVIFASAPFLYLFINDWWQLIPVRFYHGFATAIFVPVAEASIAELFPTRRGERISLFTSATYIGRIIAPTLGGYVLAATNNGFHQVYLAVGVVAVTGLITAMPFLAKERRPAKSSERSASESIKSMFQGWRTIASNGGVVIVSLIQASQYYVFGAFDTYLAYYLLRGLKYGTISTGLIASSVLAVAIFARPFMGRVSDKIGRGIPIVFGCVLSALALVTVPFMTDFAVLLILLVVYGFGFATVTSSTSPLICELVHSQLVGTSMGFLDTMMDIGQTLGAFVTGLVFATSFQYTGVFLSFAIVLLFSCAVFAVWKLVGKRNTGKSR